MIGAVPSVSSTTSICCLPRTEVGRKKGALESRQTCSNLILPLLISCPTPPARIFAKRSTRPVVKVIHDCERIHSGAVTLNLSINHAQEEVK